jgi:hypothetical protein
LQRRFRKVPGDCWQCAHERQRIRVERRRKGLTLVPAPALRDFQSLCSRAGLPRGAYAPRSCVAAERPSAKKRLLRCTNAHPAKSGGRQPAVGVSIALATALPLSHARPPTVYVRIAVAFALIVATGGLRPPLLVARTHILGDARLRFATAFCFTLLLRCGRLAAKKRFLRCTNARSPRSSDRQPAVARSYDRCAARSECCSATSEHTTRSGGREPAVVRETYLQHRYRTRSGTLVSCGNKSGGRQPAVLFGKRACNTDTAHVCRRSFRAETEAALVGPPWAWETRLRRSKRACPADVCGCLDDPFELFRTSAQIQACLFGGPPTVCGGIAVALALIVTTGGLRPRSCVALRTSAGEKTIFAMHKRTLAQERWASARRGRGSRTCNGASAKSQETAGTLLTNAGAVAVMNHRGLTLLPAPALRDFQSLCSRARFPRGADAPRSWLHARISSEMRGCDSQRRFVSHGEFTLPALVL